MNTEPSFFSVTNNDVKQVFGYSQPVPTLSTCVLTSSFKEYYVGVNATEDPNNPGNSLPASQPPQTTYYQAYNYDLYPAPLFVEACSCATQRFGYGSFDLHFLVSQNRWVCVSYWMNNSDASYLSVVNSDVDQAYGYSL